MNTVVSGGGLTELQSCETLYGHKNMRVQVGITMRNSSKKINIHWVHCQVLVIKIESHLILKSVLK